MSLLEKIALGFLTLLMVCALTMVFSGIAFALALLLGVAVPTWVVLGIGLVLGALMAASLYILLRGSRR